MFLKTRSCPAIPKTESCPSQSDGTNEPHDVFLLIHSKSMLFQNYLETAAMFLSNLFLRQYKPTQWKYLLLLKISAQLDYKECK